MATPYVISSDLVSAYPAKSLEIAQYIDGFKADLALVQNAQTGTTYSFVAADFTKLVTLSNASPVAVELPLEATVPWPTGTQLRLLNQGAGTVTVAGAVGVTINGTPLTLAQYKGAALIKTGTDTWTFAPFSSGVGAADFSDAATGSYSGFKYLTFTSSGTITVTTAGFADIVLCGGGGAGGAGNAYSGGGAGGVLQLTSVYLPAGTLTVTVGAGGAVGDNGVASRIGGYLSPGGGAGGPSSSNGLNGGSGGGASWGTKTGGAGISGIGNAGGTSNSGGAAGGGGGAGAVGVNGNANAGGAGGAGTTVSLAGTTPSGAYVAGNYALGGGGGAHGDSTSGAGGSGGGGAGGGTNNGTANTGGGGGGWLSGNAGQGGSGIVIVRVAV
jgi:hypothetical protein